MTVVGKMKWIVVIGIVCTIAMQTAFFEMEGNKESPAINSAIITIEEDCSCSEMSVDWKSGDHDWPKKVMVETVCTDGIDSDGDGLIDLEDGDCWLKEGPIYQTHPRAYPNHSFKEVTQQIPKLADLGVKTIYLMPIWEHPRGKKTIYSIYDYFKIDPECGTPQELKELVDTAHRYNMKVLFDFVTCCTPKGSVVWNNNWTLSMSLAELERRAKELGWKLEYKTVNGNKFVYANCRKSEEQLLCDVAGIIIDNNTVILRHYPRADWGFAIDRTNPDAIEYFTKVAEYYVKEYNIDGWRLDAPSDNWNPKLIPEDHSITNMMRNVKGAITKIKPCAILLAETPFPGVEEICDYLYGRDVLRWILTTKPTSAELVEEIKDVNNRVYHIPDLEKYDLSVQQQKALLVLISTLPGVPMVRAGEEIGIRGSSESGPINWEEGNYELREFYKKVFEIRNSHPALKYGTISNVWKSGDNTYAYLRESEDEKVITVINFLNKEAASILDLSFLENGTILYDELNDEAFVIDDPSNFEISIPADGSRILVLKKRDEPIVYFGRPLEGYLYVFDQEIISTIFGNTIILGKITIEADAYDEDGIQKVEFYVDNGLRTIDDSPPYLWHWDEFAIGWHEIKVVAYDNSGNKAEDRINVITLIL